MIETGLRQAGSFDTAALVAAYSGQSVWCRGSGYANACIDDMSKMRWTLWERAALTAIRSGS